MKVGDPRDGKTLVGPLIDRGAYEKMQKALKQVHSMAETLPEDADNAQLAEAKQLVAKSLGDDARDLSDHLVRYLDHR